MSFIHVNSSLYFTYLRFSKNKNFSKNVLQQISCFGTTYIKVQTFFERS